MTKDNTPVTSLTENQLELQVSYIGTSAIIRLPKFKVQIKWDKKVSASCVIKLVQKLKVLMQLNIEINAPAELREKTTGMCGVWDGDASNDWQDIDFKNHNLPGFVASWVDDAIKGKNQMRAIT